MVSILRRVIKDSPGYQEAVLLITSICSHLRALVFDTPELWGFVSMRGTLGPLSLERCQWNPVSVVPFFWEGDSKGTARIYACLNYWKSMPVSHLTRVELVEFSGTYENFEAVSWIFNFHMPDLETLRLASGSLTTGEIILLDEEDPEVWIINPSTQHTVQEVHLQQIFIPWTSNVFYGLSTLFLDYRGFDPEDCLIPMDAFLEVFSHSPRLEKCTVYFAIPQCNSRGFLQDSKPTRTINLLHLKNLTLFDETLNLAYLLRHLSFPTTTKTLLKADTPPDQLEDLLSTLIPRWSNIEFDTPNQISFECKSHRPDRPVLVIGHTTIEYLDEWGPVLEPDDITHTTFALPLLEAVHRGGSSVRILKIHIGVELTMQPAVWKVVLLGQTGENGLICPNLRHLLITDDQGIPQGSLACLAARWKLERPLDVFHLRVGNCERSLAEHTIEYLRPSVSQLILEIYEGAQFVSLTFPGETIVSLRFIAPSDSSDLGSLFDDISWFSILFGWIFLESSNGRPLEDTIRCNTSFLNKTCPCCATRSPALSELVEGYPYPRTRPPLLDRDVSSSVVRVSEIAVSFAVVFLLTARRRHRLHRHRHHHPPKTQVNTGNGWIYDNAHHSVLQITQPVVGFSTDITHKLPLVLKLVLLFVQLLLGFVILHVQLGVHIL